MANEPTYHDLLKAVRSKVPGSELRFAEVPSPFRYSWWPSDPTFEQELMSDYGVESSIPSLSKEFMEEISAIRDTLKELGHKVELAPWQKNGLNAGERLMEGLNYHAKALSLWEELCFPVRRCGDVVFRIRAPDDVMGTPIIQKLSLDDYVRGVTIRTARGAIESIALTKSRDTWRGVAVALMVLLAMFLVRWYFVA